VDPEHCLVRNSKSLSRDEEINWHIFALLYLGGVKQERALFCLRPIFTRANSVGVQMALKHFLLSKIEYCKSVAARFDENSKYCTNS
jgi:hypothetical protein